MKVSKGVEGGEDEDGEHHLEVEYNFIRASKTGTSKV